MKKFTLIAGLALAVSFFSTHKASAQVTANSASFNLNVVLADVISVTLGASPDVTFTYATAADYAASKTVSKTGHFSVVSTQNYNVTVTAGAAFNTISGTTIPLSAVNMAVNRTAMLSGVGGSDATATLSTTPAALTNGALPSVSSVYNIDYTIPSAAPLVGKKAGTYTTTVIYTATQI